MFVFWHWWWIWMCPCVFFISTSCQSCHWGDSGDQESWNEWENPIRRYSFSQCLSAVAQCPVMQNIKCKLISLSRLSATTIFDCSILFNFVITVFYFYPYLPILLFLQWAFSNISCSFFFFLLSSATPLRFAWKCTASFYDTKTVDVFQTPKAGKKPEEKPTPAVTEPSSPKGTKKTKMLAFTYLMLNSTVSVFGCHTYKIFNSIVSMLSFNLWPPLIFWNFPIILLNFEVPETKKPEEEKVPVVLVPEKKEIPFPKGRDVWF